MSLKNCVVYAWRWYACFRQGQGNGTIAYTTTGIDFSDGTLTETNYTIRIKGDEVPGSLVTQVSPGENFKQFFTN